MKFIVLTGRFLLDETQASQQGLRQMLVDLPARVAALNRVAEGFYQHWLQLAFGDLRQSACPAA